MNPQILGEIRVDAISEMDRWLVDASVLLPDSTSESLAEHLHWLGPRLVDSVSGKLVMSMHAYLIRTRHHTILFDTCCGNDKERPVLPIVRHDLAVLVEDDHSLEGELPDEVRYVPLVGHTKHHCGLRLRSRSQDAILTGDAIHHPVQLARNDWVQAPCYDKQAAQQTVKDLISRCIDTSTRMLTAHFPAPTAGRVVSRPQGVRFEFDAE